MKRFRFRLDALLRYHQQRQKQADLAVAQANREREMAAQAVRQIEQAIDTACRLSEAVGQPIEPALREQSLRLAHQLAQSLQVAQEKLKTAEHRFREAQNLRTAITQDVEALLQLRHQEWEAHQDEAAKQQQIEVDDVVMKQWSRRMARARTEAVSAEP